MKLTDLLTALIAFDQAYAHIVNLVTAVKGTLSNDDQTELQKQLVAIRKRNDERYAALIASFKTKS